MAEEPNTDLEQECFFIAPIGEEGSDERNRSDGILQFIVQAASTELGLKAVRADQISQPGLITLQVLDHVLGARAAVADLTGKNANVFYELAVRHTARLPVVLIADKDEKLPFDIAQMRTVFFDHTDLKSADQCRREIVSQLQEAFDGAVDSPITTAVDVKALQSGNRVERSVAELVQNVEELARVQRASIEAIVDAVEAHPGAPQSGALRYALDHAYELSDLAVQVGDERVIQLAREIVDPLEYMSRRSRGLRPRAISRIDPTEVKERDGPGVGRAPARAAARKTASIKKVPGKPQASAAKKSSKK